MGVVLKRAQYVLLTADHPRGVRMERESVARALMDPGVFSFGTEQLSLFAPQRVALPGAGDVKNPQEAVQEVARCLAAAL
jgi:hypothetical protein